MKNKDKSKENKLFENRINNFLKNNKSIDEDVIDLIRDTADDVIYNRQILLGESDELIEQTILKMLKVFNASTDLKMLVNQVALYREKPSDLSVKCHVAFLGNNDIFFDKSCINDLKEKRGIAEKDCEALIAAMSSVEEIRVSKRIVAKISKVFEDYIIDGFKSYVDDEDKYDLILYLE